MIMFEDFDTLKKRVISLQRERMQCEPVLDCMAFEIQMLRE
jgi:hypothetical protein